PSRCGPIRNVVMPASALSPGGLRWPPRPVTYTPAHRNGGTGCPRGQVSGGRNLLASWSESVHWSLISTPSVFAGYLTAYRSCMLPYHCYSVTEQGCLAGRQEVARKDLPEPITTAARTETGCRVVEKTLNPRGASTGRSGRTQPRSSAGWSRPAGGVQRLWAGNRGGDRPQASRRS